jgi:hypothetical protein
LACAPLSRGLAGLFERFVAHSARGTDSRAFLPFPFSGNPSQRTNPTTGRLGLKSLSERIDWSPRRFLCSQQTRICGTEVLFLPRPNECGNTLLRCLSPLTQWEAKKEQTRAERGKGGQVKLPSGKLSWLVGDGAASPLKGLPMSAPLRRLPDWPKRKGSALLLGTEAKRQGIPRGRREAVVNRNC